MCILLFQELVFISWRIFWFFVFFQLTYDYKFDFEDDQHKIPCLCGAPNCRKWMNWFVTTLVQHLRCWMQHIDERGSACVLSEWEILPHDKQDRHVLCFSHSPNPLTYSTRLCPRKPTDLWTAAAAVALPRSRVCCQHQSWCWTSWDKLWQDRLVTVSWTVCPVCQHMHTSASDARLKFFDSSGNHLSLYWYELKSLWCWDAVCDVPGTVLTHWVSLRHHVLQSCLYGFHIVSYYMFRGWQQIFSPTYNKALFLLFCGHLYILASGGTLL